MPIDSKIQSGRISSLDGIRAFSICSVMVCHIGETHFLHAPALVRELLLKGGFGVEIFFVVSGFIITWLLLTEEAQRGNLGVPAFYGRRALRILPPAFLYLIAVGLLTWAGFAKASERDIIAAALFFRNLIVGGSTETGHYWTLSIEEQFYLIWPFILLAVKGNPPRLKIAVGLLIFAPVWRQLNYHLAGGAANVDSWRFDLRYDALISGCTLALLRFDKRWLTRLQNRLILNPLTPLLTSAILLYAVAGSAPKYLRFALPSLQLACVALLITYLIDRPTGLAGRTLNARPVVWIGMLSYSLYLWQQLFLKGYSSHLLWIRSLPQSLIATLACACVSFYFVERPFARLRKTVFSRNREAAVNRPAPQRATLETIPQRVDVP